MGLEFGSELGGSFGEPVIGFIFEGIEYLVDFVDKGAQFFDIAVRLVAERSSVSLSLPLS